MAGRRRSGRKGKNIYFGRNSVFRAVKDIGKPGVRSAKEVRALAVAQFLDWLDGKTKNRQGKTVRFTGRIWAGRMKVLHILASKYGGKRALQQIEKLKRAVENGQLSKKEARELALRLAGRWHVRRLLEKVRI